MLLQQEPYCKRVLKRFGMDFAKAAPTPMVKNIESLLREAASSEVGKDFGKDDHTGS